MLLYRRLATMVAAGVTIDRALAFLADSSEPALQRVVQSLRGQVLDGKTLDYAMKSPELAGVFSPLAIGLVSTGFQSGGLVGCLAKLADLAERTQKQKRALLAALTYPAILALCILGVGLFFVLVIAPGDQGLFAAFGGRLPWPSRVLVDLGSVLRNPLVWLSLLAAGLLGATVGPRLWHSSPFLRRQVDQIVLDLPAVGPLVEKAMAARVLYILSTTLQVGVPVTQALTMCGQVLGNSVLRSKLESCQRLFEQGTELGEALAAVGLFPTLVTQMVTVGGETGQMDKLLERLSQLYEEEVESALENFARVLEPIMLGVAGVMAGFVALAALLPVIQIVDQL